MCFFPFSNTNHKSEAYKKGVTHFDCGVCPECLSKKARLWALRCSAEAQYTQGCMITLTYDNYARDKNGNIIGELPPNRDLPLSKRDCQLFIKRLRKHFDMPFIKQANAKVNHKLNLMYAKSGMKISKRQYKADMRKKYKDEIEEFKKSYLSTRRRKISYLLTAERGKRTNRAHYHSILFGVDFLDKVRYKMSDRGNIIYKSKTLTDIWGKGICTIDAVNINSQVARYCTKYCAKDSRVDDTFMLMSRGIGDRWLLDNFNGISYMLEGREYSIPKLIWCKKVTEHFQNNYIFNMRGATYKYKSLKSFLEKDDSILADWKNEKQRKYFRNFRDSWKLYKNYLAYWKRKADTYELTQPNAFTRILQLDDKKYHQYKVAALKCLSDRHNAPSFIYDRENYYLPTRYTSQRRKLKLLYEMYRICPPPLVIKGQMTPNKNTSKKTRFELLSIRTEDCWEVLPSWQNPFEN